MSVIELVGIGPGLRGLLTVRALEALGAAEVVVYGAAIPAEILALAHDAAERHVASGEPAEVGRRLAGWAEAGRRVVRLYPGDVLTSLEGSAEAQALWSLGARFEIVPGLSPGLAAATFAGVTSLPASTLQIVHTGDISGDATSVSETSAPDLASAAEALARAGLSRSAAVVAVTGAGRSTQRILESTVAELAAGGIGPGSERVGGREAPGGVVLAPASERLPWFERRPLLGRRVVVTRPRAQAASFIAWLEAQGAEPIAFPAIRISPSPDPGPLGRVALAIADFDWLVLTSVNGVDRFWAALDTAGLDTRALGGVRVAAIGPATAAALTARGVRPDVVPDRYIAEAVVEAMAAACDLRDSRILLPRAHGAREVLPVELAARGARVTEVEAYRSVPDVEGAGQLRARLARGEIDALTFTSSSTVQNFVEAVGVDIGRAVVACIGPVTAETARAAGLPVGVVATQYTIAGLSVALEAYFEALRRPAPSAGSGSAET